MEKNLEKKLNHFAVHLKRIQYCKSTIVQFFKNPTFRKNYINFLLKSYI